MTSRDVDATSSFTDRIAIVTSIPFEIESNPLGFSKSEKSKEMTFRRQLFETLVGHLVQKQRIANY